MHTTDTRDQEINVSDAMKEFLDGVVGVIEATHFEQHVLWKENRDRIKPRTWVSNNLGIRPTIGLLDDMPVVLSMFTTEVDGKKLLFYEGVSQVVDHRMIDKWFKENLPPTAFRPDGHIHREDAGNFGCIF